MVKIRTAECFLRKVSKTYIWVIPECPFCGEEHEHGGGRLGDDPKKFLGLRVSHCASPSVGGQYILQEKVS